MAKEKVAQLSESYFVNNSFIKRNREIIPIVNPSTLENIGNIPILHDSDVIDAIDSAVAALKGWGALSASNRSKLLTDWHDLILENQNLLAEILVLEQGKPFLEAQKEIIYGAGFIKWFAAEAEKLSGYIAEGTKENQKIMLEYEPVGVVAAITPWNFPSAMITRKIAPAIAAGCTIVLKPSELTPFSALALAELAKKANIPAGVLNIITGKAEQIGKIFAEDFRIRKLSFTGSSRVGKILYENSALTLKKLSLELGGNAPFIVFEDANLELAASHLLLSKLRNMGQACIAPNRIFLHNNIHDKFLSFITDKFNNIKVGDGNNQSVNAGPLINKQALDKLERLIADAVTKGAKVLIGGSKATTYFDKDDNEVTASLEQNFFLPTILVNCTNDMNIFHEEIFGPILAIYKFESIDDVIKQANNTQYGLASYIFTQSTSLAFKVSSELDFGIVGINEGIISNNIGAFGGRKDSGFGVEGSKLGILEFLNTKYICLNYQII